MKAKLFIAEYQPNLRKGLLKMAGKRSAEWVVAGEAANGRAALSSMEQCVPDLLLTDIRMPHMDGLYWRTGRKLMMFGSSAFRFIRLHCLLKWRSLRRPPASM